ncbi:SMC-Scp complex subunit ScpB [Exilibacterium tricleocarpae]|uniref:SMC-Scp complex subunit ScpB n=1 Tax=Exilibacterium tricleocarpae TaxID=2591008 RepID=UPI001FE7DF3C|nr:SMC-Scp complex subunit ScpB [Exilibacterium tricleocarpae]
MMMERDQLRRIVEGALLAAGQPLNIARLQSLFEEDEPPAKDELQAVLEDIQTDCRGRGFELKEVGSGWRFQVREESAPWVNRLWEEKPQKYSRALLETLALIAYRQPITRGDIEEIRGVAVSSHIIKTLTEREWVKVVGHRDVPGRPSLYATTRRFLDYFNLKSLEELPTLSEISDLEKLNPELELGIEEPAASAAEPGADGEASADGEALETEALIELDEDMAAPFEGAAAADEAAAPPEEVATPSEKIPSAASEPLSAEKDTEQAPELLAETLADAIDTKPGTAS